MLDYYAQHNVKGCKTSMQKIKKILQKTFFYRVIYLFIVKHFRKAKKKVYNTASRFKKKIKKLKEVAQYLRNEEPLNKVIWKVYYENPTSELIGRVVGSGVHTGIYKITDIESKRCYVGQSANIAERFK